MERRKFLGHTAGAGLAGILAAGVAPAVHAQQAIRWRMASSFPKTLDIPHGGVLAFAHKVKAMSGGKIDISVHAADELMPAFGVLDGVQRGSVECAHTSPAYFLDKNEAFALDNAIPFGLGSRQMTAWMLHGNGLALLREFYREYGIVNFPLGNTGAQMGGWYRKPVKSPADLKGLKIRIHGLGGQLMKRLGALPVTLPGGEIYQALERGQIAAAEWIGPYDDLKLGLHKTTRYYAYPGWWQGSSQFSLYVNQRAFDALTAENKAIIEVAAAAAHLDIQAQYDAKNPAALKELIATGTTLMPFPKTVLDAAWKAAQALYAELSASNPHWRKIYASYAAFLDAQAWQQGYGEIPMDNYLHQKALAQKKRPKSVPTQRR